MVSDVEKRQERSVREVGDLGKPGIRRAVIEFVWPGSVHIYVLRIQNDLIIISLPGRDDRIPWSVPMQSRKVRTFITYADRELHGSDLYVKLSTQLVSSSIIHTISVLPLRQGLAVASLVHTILVEFRGITPVANEKRLAHQGHSLHGTHKPGILHISTIHISRARWDWMAAGTTSSAQNDRMSDSQ